MLPNKKLNSLYTFMNNRGFLRESKMIVDIAKKAGLLGPKLSKQLMEIVNVMMKSADSLRDKIEAFEEKYEEDNDIIVSDLYEEGDPEGKLPEFEKGVDDIVNQHGDIMFEFEFSELFSDSIAEYAKRKLPGITKACLAGSFHYDDRPEPAFFERTYAESESDEETGLEIMDGKLFLGFLDIQIKNYFLNERSMPSTIVHEVAHAIQSVRFIDADGEPQKNFGHFGKDRMLEVLSESGDETEVRNFSYDFSVQQYLIAIEFYGEIVVELKDKNREPTEEELATMDQIYDFFEAKEEVHFDESLEEMSEDVSSEEELSEESSEELSEELSEEDFYSAMVVAHYLRPVELVTRTSDYYLERGAEIAKQFDNVREIEEFKLKDDGGANYDLPFAISIFEKMIPRAALDEDAIFTEADAKRNDEAKQINLMIDQLRSMHSQEKTIRNPAVKNTFINLAARLMIFQDTDKIKESINDEKFEIFDDKSFAKEFKEQYRRKMTPILNKRDSIISEKAIEIAKTIYSKYIGEQTDGTLQELIRT